MDRRDRRDVPSLNKKVYEAPRIVDLGDAVAKTLGGGGGQYTEVLGGLPSGWD